MFISKYSSFLKSILISRMLDGIDGIEMMGLKEKVIIGQLLCHH